MNQGPEGDAVLSHEVICKSGSVFYWTALCARFSCAFLSLFVSTPGLCSPSLAARADYPKLLREYVSRQSAGKGRAVLEGVELSAEAIDMYYVNNPLNEEAFVQSGLLDWARGKAKGRHPTTWEVLIGAMKYGRISVQYINKLKEELQKGACAHAHTSPSSVVFDSNWCANVKS